MLGREIPGNKEYLPEFFGLGKKSGDKFSIKREFHFINENHTKRAVAKLFQRLTDKVESYFLFKVVGIDHRMIFDRFVFFVLKSYSDFLFLFPFYNPPGNAKIDHEIILQIPQTHIARYIHLKVFSSHVSETKINIILRACSI